MRSHCFQVLASRQRYSARLEQFASMDHLITHMLCSAHTEPLRAVVIGAGLTGLTTAHCLADGLFDEVTLLERDDVVAANGASKEDQV